MTRAAKPLLTLKPKTLKKFKTSITDEGRECTGCGEFKSWESFNIATKSYTGRTSLCRDCKKSGRKPRDYKREKFSAKLHKSQLKKEQPYLVKARAIRSSLLNRARKFPELRATTPATTAIQSWLEAQPLVCYYTGKELTLWEMHIDHKIPPFRGGLNELLNLCIASPKINASKGQMTEVEFVSLLNLIRTWEDEGEKLLVRLRQGFM